MEPRARSIAAGWAKLPASRRRCAATRRARRTPAPGLESPGSVPLRRGSARRSMRMADPVAISARWRAAWNRAAPTRVKEGDHLMIGEATGSMAGMAATVARAAGRRVELVVRSDGDTLWQALYAAGAPVQYAHRTERLPLWSVQTAYAGRPW